MLYFAYGANLDPNTMRKRVPGSKPLCVTRLPAHAFGFDKACADGTARATVHQAPASRVVHGAIYEVPDFRLLDKYEGHPEHYTRQQRAVVVRGTCEILSAWVYEARLLDFSLLPPVFYIQRILNGIDAWGLPRSYRQEVIDRSYGF